jgi:hypothetical protein
MLAKPLFLSLLLFLLPALNSGLPGALGVAPEDEVSLRGALERLRAGSAPERAAAQRWLAAHLKTSDYALLAAKTREADAEAGRRLVDALASDGAHLGLAVLLCGEDNDILADLGERAFLELVADWCPQARERPASRVRINAHLARGAARETIDAPRSEAAREAFERLARWHMGGLPLVLAPVAAGEPVVSQGLRGGLLAQLTSLTRSAGLSYAGVGDFSGEEPGAGAWILITLRGGARSESGAQRLLRWCRAVEAGAPSAADAARALAASAWPAALDWLEERWLKHGDAAALEGLLLAAPLGRVSLVFKDREALRGLLARADAALAPGGAGRAQAQRIGRALASTAAMSLGGDDRSLDLFTGWHALSASSRWLRLWILEGRRSGRGDVQRQLLEVVGQDRRVPAALRMQALRALVAAPRLPEAAVGVEGARELVTWALERGLGGELIEIFDALGVDLDGVDLDGAASPGGVAQRAFAAHWSLRRGDHDGLVRILMQSASASEPLADLAGPTSESWIRAMVRWRRSEGRSELQRAVRSALEQLEPVARVRLSELALLAGGLDAPGQAAAFEGLSAKAELSTLDYALLGALAASESGAEARADLLEYLAAPPLAPEAREALARGLDFAVFELRARRRDSEAQAFMALVWRAISAKNHPLQSLLSPERWPSRVPAVALRIDLFEREIPAKLP